MACASSCDCGFCRRYYFMFMVAPVFILISALTQNIYAYEPASVFDEPVVVEKESGIYGKLKSFVNELGNVMKDVRFGVEKLSDGLQSLEEVLDATIDEECSFECPKGETIHTNPLHKSTSNGCGALGLEKYLTQEMIPFVNQFVDCCHEHDICYGTCLNDKDICDLKFKKCLYRKCNTGNGVGNEDFLHEKLKQKGCKAGAKVLYTGTATLGCKPYLNAQNEACLCKKTKHKGDKGLDGIKKDEL